MNDKDIFNFFAGFKAISDNETEKEIIDNYIKGLITKEQFLKKMKKAEK